ATGFLRIRVINTKGGEVSFLYIRCDPNDDRKSLLPEDRNVVATFYARKSETFQRFRRKAARLVHDFDMRRTRVILLIWVHNQYGSIALSPAAKIRVHG